MGSLKYGSFVTVLRPQGRFSASAVTWFISFWGRKNPVVVLLLKASSYSRPLSKGVVWGNVCFPLSSGSLLRCQRPLSASACKIPTSGRRPPCSCEVRAGKMLCWPKKKAEMSAEVGRSVLVGGRGSALRLLEHQPKRGRGSRAEFGRPSI